MLGPRKRLFFSGDTAYYDGFREIGSRLGPFDLAAVSIGAYLPPVIMKGNHTTPEEALQVFADVRGSVFVPVHWGTFDLAEEALDEPPRRLWPRRAVAASGPTASGCSGTVRRGGGDTGRTPRGRWGEEGSLDHATGGRRGSIRPSGGGGL